jgi:hypothetical protein
MQLAHHPLCPYRVISRSRIRFPSLAGGLVSWAILLPVLCSAQDRLAPLEKAAGDWVKIRMETVRLESAWATEKPLLESTISGLKERASALEEKRDLAKAQTAKEREELELISARGEAGAEEIRKADAQLKVMTKSLLSLRPTLPPRLAAALTLPFRTLESSDPAPTTGERMQLIASVLNRCSQFNRMITSGEEILPVDGTERLYQTIYWGLSYGYALDRETRVAWFGSPTADGWSWQRQPDAAAAVAKLLAVYGDEADPELLLLPAKLRQIDNLSTAQASR